LCFARTLCEQRDDAVQDDARGPERGHDGEAERNDASDELHLGQVPRWTATEREFVEPRSPGQELLFELRPRAQRPIRPICRASAAAPPGAAVGLVSPLEEDDVRQVGRLDGVPHSGIYRIGGAAQ
jgi:hypothetical protein